MPEPSQAIVLEGAPAYLAEVQRALGRQGIAAEIVKPPGGKPNT